MARTINAIAASAANPRATLARTWGFLVWHMFGEYRPELYYMRGPGPAWRRKHHG